MNERKHVFRIEIDVFDEHGRFRARATVSEPHGSVDEWVDGDAVTAVRGAANWSVEMFERISDALAE